MGAGPGAGLPWSANTQVQRREADCASQCVLINERTERDSQPAVQRQTKSVFEVLSVSICHSDSAVREHFSSIHGFRRGAAPSPQRPPRRVATQHIDEGKNALVVEAHRAGDPPRCGFATRAEGRMVPRP